MRWQDYIRSYRRRLGLSQMQLALMLGVSQRTISRWERGEDRPSPHQQQRLRALGWRHSPDLMTSLRLAVRFSPVPRALSRLDRLRLVAVSPPAIAKRPSIVARIGTDLEPLATGVLALMLADRALQRGIRRGDVLAVSSVTDSVLRTPEHARIGRWRTTITYFEHDGIVYSDAQSAPASAADRIGYRPITPDDITDHDGTG